MSFLGKRDVADTLVVRVSLEVPAVSDVIEILNILTKIDETLRHAAASTLTVSLVLLVAITIFREAKSTSNKHRSKDTLDISS